MENSVKATVDSLRLPTFQVFEIPFPPTLSEQTRIARILSDMDVEIARLATKLEKYRQMKLGMMQNLLTGKIRLVDCRCGSAAVVSRRRRIETLHATSLRGGNGGRGQQLAAIGENRPRNV